MAGNKNSGRKKTPTAILEALGSQHAKRPDEPATIAPDPDEPIPDWLGPAATLIWRKLLPQAMALGVISVTDLEGFAILCESYADLMDMEHLCKTRQKWVPVYNRDGTEKIGAKEAPWARRVRYLRRDVFAMLREYGLTPSSRPDILAIGTVGTSITEGVTDVEVIP